MAGQTIIFNVFDKKTKQQNRNFFALQLGGTNLPDTYSFGQPGVKAFNFGNCARNVPRSGTDLFEPGQTKFPRGTILAYTEFGSLSEADCNPPAGAKKKTFDLVEYLGQDWILEPTAILRQQIQLQVFPMVSRPEEPVPVP
ncbi:hypothetical protein BH11PSE2_BH11PSE2_18610 [soil metagenome]